MSKQRSLFIFILKLIFSLSIIAFILLKKTPINEIGESIKGASLFWIGLSFSLHSLGLLISAYRWQILIHAQDDHVPLGFLAKSYLVGNFLTFSFLQDLVGMLSGFWTDLSIPNLCSSQPLLFLWKGYPESLFF